MPAFSWNEIHRAFLLLWERRPSGLLLYAAGGAVPWLLTGRNSGRLHGDLDVVVRLEDMPLLRRFLQDQGWYRPDWDSRSLPCNLDGADYGLQALTAGVPVNFAPFLSSGANLIQRNFTLASQAGFDSMITAVMGDLSASDYAVLSPAPGAGIVGTLSPEVVRAAKERSAQNRDLPDLEALASLPFDPARYRRVKEAVSGMQIRFQG